MPMNFHSTLLVAWSIAVLLIVEAVPILLQREMDAPLDEDGYIDLSRLPWSHMLHLSKPIHFRRPATWPTAESLQERWDLTKLASLPEAQALKVVVFEGNAIEYEARLLPSQQMFCKSLPELCKEEQSKIMTTLADVTHRLLRGDGIYSAVQVDERKREMSFLASRLQGLEFRPAKSDVARRVNSQLFFAGANTTAWWHYDRSNNFASTFFGERIWYLLPPSALEAMQPFPMIHPRQRRASISPEAAGVSDQILKVRLLPGEVLFIPPHWAHSIHSPMVSLGFQQFIDTNTWPLFFGGPRMLLGMLGSPTQLEAQWFAEASHLTKQAFRDAGFEQPQKLCRHRWNYFADDERFADAEQFLQRRRDACAKLNLSPQHRIAEKGNAGSMWIERVAAQIVSLLPKSVRVTWLCNLWEDITLHVLSQKGNVAHLPAWMHSCQDDIGSAGSAIKVQL